MIGLPAYLLKSTEGTTTPLQAALDAVAEELALLGPIEPECEPLGESAGLYIGGKLRDILQNRRRARGIAAGKPWTPGKRA